MQLQLHVCKHDVIIATSVGPWERSCVCCVDPGLEAFGCQDEVSLVVNLPIRGIPDCCPRQLVGVESVGKGEPVLFANSRSLHPLSFVSAMPNLSTVPAQCWYASGFVLTF